MLIIPVRGDKIRTKDDSEYKYVTSYSSLKSEPAVYVRPAGIDSFVLFDQIIEINGVKVEYDSSSKVFNSLGPIKRKFNIPQPKDIISVKLIDASFNKEVENFEVTGIKLHSKKYGSDRGLLIITKDGEFTINEILNIERTGWYEKFDFGKFKSYYFDYLPIRHRKK